METKKRPVEFVTKRIYKGQNECSEKNFKGDDRFNIETEKGLFHQWGSYIQEGEDTVASFTVGIIEDENGKIHTPIASNIKFLDK